MVEFGGKVIFSLIIFNFWMKVSFCFLVYFDVMNLFDRFLFCNCKYCIVIVYCLIKFM